MNQTIENITQLIQHIEDKPFTTSGYTLEEIEKAEAKLNMPLPLVLKEFYLTVATHPMYQDDGVNILSFFVLSPESLLFYPDIVNPDDELLTIFMQGTNGYDYGAVMRKSELSNPNPTVQIQDCEGFTTDEVLLDEFLVKNTMYSFENTFTQKAVFQEVMNTTQGEMNTLNHSVEISEGVFWNIQEQVLLSRSEIRTKSPNTILNILGTIENKHLKGRIMLEDFDENNKRNIDFLHEFDQCDIFANGIKLEK